ncbi:unnamed protein product [Urochloa decumbens]|uniref:NAD-dependent epimerase/dehydratase domain-containing protein n=1 Tax=Urochloa decumbens TaxID=240449 RepID=A0ABC9GF74_9POAL
MDDAMATAGDGHPARGGVVCVTGGSGFIGSWLVRYLLDRGYSVHATVRNIQDEGETMHLHALDGAGTRLRLFQIDLLDLPSIRAAIEGAQGVFHLASPLIVQTQDPETELLEPAVKGTLNVLRAAKDSGVGRVVLVSSKAAMVPNPNWPADKVLDEDSWADVELLRKLEHWYGVSKTLAEKAAWDFAAEEGLQLVVLNPGLVLGPFLTPSVNASLNWFLQLLSEQASQAKGLTWTCTWATWMSETWPPLWSRCTRPHHRRDGTYAWSPLNAWLISPTKLLIFTLNSLFRELWRINKAG